MTHCPLVTALHFGTSFMHGTTLSSSCPQIRLSSVPLKHPMSGLQQRSGAKHRPCPLGPQAPHLNKPFLLDLGKQPQVHCYLFISKAVWLSGGRAPLATPGTICDEAWLDDGGNAQQDQQQVQNQETKTFQHANGTKNDCSRSSMNVVLDWIRMQIRNEIKKKMRNMNGKYPNRFVNQ